MRAETITGWSAKELDIKLNNFMSNKTIDIIDVKFSNPILYFSALILYKDKY